MSLDQPVGNELDGSLGELVVAPAAREEPEDLLALPGLLAALPEPEREVIALRFFQDLDQDTIAPRVGFSRCTSRGCSAGPWPACALSWWNLDLAKEMLAMQVIGMVMVSLGLALSGVLGLALVTHVAAWTRRR